MFTIRYLHVLIQHWAIQKGDQVAFVFVPDGEQSKTEITYLELEHRVRVVATNLRTQAASGERVILFYPPGLEYIVSFLACLQAGIIPVLAYVPDNCNLSYIQEIAADAGATIVLSTKSLILRMNILEQISDIEYILRRESQKFLNSNLRNKCQLIWLVTNEGAGECKTFRFPTKDNNDIALVQYSSGSTNFYTTTYRKLLYNCCMMAQTLGCTPESYSVSLLPPYNVIGIVTGILLPLYYGFSGTIIEPRSILKKPFRWLQEISNSKDKGNVISGGPEFAYQKCINRISAEQVALLDLCHWETAFGEAELGQAGTLLQFSSKFAAAGFQRKALLPVPRLTECSLLASPSSLDLQQKSGQKIKRLEVDKLIVVPFVPVSGIPGWN
ncbi:MAG: AMP-binding protein, partial [Bacteroidota bacterium]|nr:AMP-binding protein [Bacteroidota bacterium]